MATAIGERTFADTLERRDLGTILHGVESEVDLRWRSLLVYGADGIFEFLAVLNGGGGGSFGHRVVVRV